MTGTGLLHKTVYEAGNAFVKILPLTPDVAHKIHLGGSFPLVRDPVKSQRTCIIGMLVLRQAIDSGWKGGMSPQDIVASNGWAFGVKGITGSGIVSQGSLLDGYRLTLQYACSDAILVGSGTVAREQEHNCAAYNQLSWPHMMAADAGLSLKLEAQRRLWQEEGYLSARRLPATIILTQTGLPRDDGADFLDSCNIRERVHADGSGEAREVYILTSQLGAEKIRPRAIAKGIAEARIDAMIMTLSPAGEPGKIDVARVPQYLYEKLDVRIANHDGGPTVLEQFLKAGALDQMHFTLCAGKPLIDCLRHHPGVGEEERERMLDEFGERVEMFQFAGGEGLSGLDVVQLIEPCTESGGEVNGGASATVVVFVPRQQVTN